MRFAVLTENHEFVENVIVAQAAQKEELEAALQGAEIVIADPMYRSICPETARFYDLPHQALSGRSGWSTMRNLITLEI